MKALSKNNLKIKIDYPLICVFVLGIMTDDTYVMLLNFTAMIAHEISHILAMILLKKTPDKIHLMAFNFKIDNDKKCNDNQSLLIILAGSAANILMFFLFYFIPNLPHIIRLFAVSNLIFGLFNLLPIIALDGGDILQIILDRIFDY